MKFAYTPDFHLLIFSASLVDIGQPREFSSDFSRQVFGKLKSDDNSNTFLGGSDSYGNVHGKSFGNSNKGKRIRDQRYSRLSLNSLDDLSAILDNLQDNLKVTFKSVNPRDHQVPISHWDFDQ